MSAPFCWPLIGGGEIEFMPAADGVFEVQHATRHYDSFGFIGRAASRPAAERMAADWLKTAGLTRARRR